MNYNPPNQSLLFNVSQRMKIPLLSRWLHDHKVKTDYNKAYSHAPDGSLAWVSKICVGPERKKVRFMRRDVPKFSKDSGWMLFSGEASRGRGLSFNVRLKNVTSTLQLVYNAYPMKNLLFPILVLSSALTLCAEPSSYKLETSSSSEVFSTKILQIYQVDADLGLYVAYVVDWRGHQIVVTPSSFSAPQAPWKVGDTVRCSMRTSPVPPGSNRKAVLSFGILTAPDAEQLETIIGEAGERRQKREAGLKDSPNTSGTVDTKNK